ncbi:AraC family transcriptional regulator [Amycolatopsis balhimycina DSM 5908]|uniref:AraC family transcriptional regulator n=1 Tax=Amycolatopsis balhimycina DSM 5908 TaxID=1081091 RepID=A0A428W6V6_AMYBA|nr:AraC family transcriptional regulator [Amycolatopsis balhimycina]RSM38820.1 AraC family transcriptional regulator [Amycolatopsis balhimycina DSM 5908]
MILRSVASTGAKREVDEPPEDADRLRREHAVQPAILRAIELLLERYFEPITLSALAAEVYVSPFHFSRIFAKATGVTPGRFLTAVRLFEAKRLLLTTSLTVSDIVCSVGYSSVGTFTSRFVRAVGMTPTEYREPEVGELLVAHSAYFQRLPSLQSLRDAGRNCASQPVGTGHLDVDLVLPDDAPPATVLVGVFADSVPQRGPVAFGGSANTRSGRLTVHGVPDGNWTVIAVADHGGHLTGGPAFTVGTAEAAVTPFDPPDVTVRLRRPALTDPPIAITLASRPTPSSRQQFATQRPHLRAVA